MADFLLLKEKRGSSPVLWVIEAKSGTPHAEENPDGLDQYLSEITEKIENAVYLWISSVLGRHGSAIEEMPPSLRDPDLPAISFRLILVIRECDDASLPKLQDALLEKLRRTVRLWAMGANVVLVMNERMARKYGLINQS